MKRIAFFVRDSRDSREKRDWSTSPARRASRASRAMCSRISLTSCERRATRYERRTKRTAFLSILGECSHVVPYVRTIEVLACRKSCFAAYNSSSGTTFLARPWMERSTRSDCGVVSRLISATNAPASFAMDANPAAGYTTPDVPITMRTSQA